MSHVEVYLRNIRYLTSLFIFEILRYVKQNTDLIYNSDIHEHTARSKDDLYIQPCNTSLLKKGVVNIGIYISV
jgi:hypothetical protein